MSRALSCMLLVLVVVLGQRSGVVGAGGAPALS